MKKLNFKAFLIPLSLGAMVFFSGCGEDDETDPTTDGEIGSVIEVDDNTTELPKTEARASLDDMNTSTADNVTQMSQSEGVEALQRLTTSEVNLDALFGDDSSTPSMRRWTGMIDPRAGMRVQEDEFDFDELKGVWDYNASIDDVEKTAESNFVVVNFPTEGSQTNNATITVEKLEFQTFTDDDGDDWEMPIAAKGSLTVDGTQLVSVDATATWEDNGEIPKTINATVEVVPFKLVAKLNNSSSTRTTGSVTLSESNVPFLGVGGGVDWADAEKENAYSIDGYVLVDDVQLQGSLDVAEFDRLDELEDIGGSTTIADYNAAMDLKLLDVSGAAAIIGEIELVDTGVEDEDPEIHIVYEDGSSEDIMPIIEDITDEADAMFEEFEGEDDATPSASVVF